VLVRGCKRAVVVVIIRGHIPACACVGLHVCTVYCIDCSASRVFL
jgi:hypothetical protein